jgi:Rad3-related DNA helicase
MCYRKVNQTIGRVVRHAHDYGIVVLLDKRFEGGGGMLARWVRGRVRVVGELGRVVEGVGEFLGGWGAGRDKG